MAIQRIIFNLLSKDELTADKIDRLYFLGSERGLCHDNIREIVLDCQVEYQIN